MTGDPTIRERLRELDDRHFPTTRERRPGWEVCDHDSMTWPCETQKALDITELGHTITPRPAATIEALRQARAALERTRQ